MGCPAALIPQPALSWPGFPQLLLIGLGCNVFIYVLSMFHTSHIATRRQITILLVISSLIIFSGYYIMYGISRPWENAIEQWRFQQLPSAACSLVDLRNTIDSTVETTQHLFLFGMILYLAGFVLVTATIAVWAYRQARQAPAAASI